MALVVDATTYSLVINSVDRISGTHNNATYSVNFQEFLPPCQNYKLAFSFQSSGGYYSDGLYSNAGPGLGYTVNIASNAVAASGVNIIPLANVLNVVVGMIVTSPLGIQSGAIVTAINANTVTISSVTTVALPIGTAFYFYLAANMNQATFSSARVLFLNQGRSYSFDTSTKGPSTNIGVLQRDIQTTTSRSNSLSCFYCQSPPRSLARPENNLLTISVMNSYSFSGGITSYTAAGVPNYSTITTNQNFLTDSNAGGCQILQDMTPYTMIIEFIRISDT